MLRSAEAFARHLRAAIDRHTPNGSGDASALASPAQVDDLLDESRFSVRWNGRECRLGQTVVFRLLGSLLLRPNQYVSHDRLLDDVWGGPRSATAVRSAVSELRRKLVAAGMEDLAESIDGTNSGYYGLLLERIPRTGGSDRNPTQIRR